MEELILIKFLSGEEKPMESESILRKFSKR
jgi:hypothetical protein